MTVRTAPRFTLIGGPNGSGKSTLVAHLKRLGFDLGIAIDPDVLARDLGGFTDENFRAAQRLSQTRLAEALRAGESVTLETVMSHPSKVALISEAKSLGFTTTLIFIATEDPSINVARVANRVALGGHHVPADTIRARYLRTMSYLAAAYAAADEALVFDNSVIGDERVSPSLVVHKRPGGTTVLASGHRTPEWTRTYLGRELPDLS